MILTGTTFNIQRFSTEDGPGIRTTVFFKGCPLQCAWCHNPEGLSPHPELVWYDLRCIAARDCLAACPHNALDLTSGGMRIDRQRCDACGACAEACPAAALEVIGQTWSVEELLVEVQKDAIFFETSGGGVTLSGGEPMAQADFVTALARSSCQAGLHVALDTCGAAPWERYEQVLPFVDLVLYDLKLWHAERHRRATGADNARILDNARRLARQACPCGFGRPLSPTIPATRRTSPPWRPDRRRTTTVERWDLLAYTNLGQPKYHRLGRAYPLEGVPLLSRAQMEALHAIAVAGARRGLVGGDAASLAHARLEGDWLRARGRQLLRSGWAPAWECRQRRKRRNYALSKYKVGYWRLFRMRWRPSSSPRARRPASPTSCPARRSCRQVTFRIA